MKKIFSLVVTVVLATVSFASSISMNVNAAEMGTPMTDSQGAGQTIPDGDYWIYSSLTPYYYLDIPGTVTNNGDNVEMTKHTPGTILHDYDTWTITYLNNGFYSIKQKGTNMCMDVTNASLNRGTNIQMCHENGTVAQEWSIIPNGAGYTIKSKCNSMVVDVEGQKTETGTNIWAWEENGVPGQMFYLVEAKVPFNGSGTESAPYQISTKEDLMTLSDLVNSDSTCNLYKNAYYEQTADIDLENDIFTPIGTRTGSNTGTGFQGQYNGNSHTIYNLNVNRTGIKQDFSGLFGWSYGDTTISNLAVFGNVTCENGSCVGGIVGEIGSGTKIKNCAFIGNVTFNGSGGGIAGSIWCGEISIENCYYNGNLTGKSDTSKVGGILGKYSTDTYSANKSIYLKDNYSVGKINTSSIDKGGIIGWLDTSTDKSLKLENNYSLVSMCPYAVNGSSHSGCVVANDAEMRLCNNKLGAPFVSNLNENFNNGYPVFEWQTTDVTIKQNVSSGFKGTGTENDPYQISSAKDLNRLATLINDESTNPLFRYAYYVQTANIDLKNEDFTPIGIHYGIDGEITSNAVFAGNYNGNYHSITNLNMTYSNDYCGLFGRVGEYNHDNSKCEIKNLSVTGAVECYSESAKAGGIVGELAYGATIKNCDYHGIVTSNGNVGSIAGFVYCGGTISACYSDANVSTESADSSSGGIVGEISVGNNAATGSTNAKVESTYYNGIISSNNMASTGAICGKINESNDKTIAFETNFFLSSSFNGGVANAVASGCTKLSEVALKACADMIGSPYIQNNDSTLNNGYPVFEWQSKPYDFLGSGTMEDPYQISSKTELEQMRSLVNSEFFNKTYGHAYYIQTANIDLKNENWIPVGVGYDKTGDFNSDKVFYGAYNGNGKYIKNLNTDETAIEAGLFGFVDGSDSAKISNLVIYGSVDSSSALHGGAIAGKLANNATVDGCGFIGDVSLSTDDTATISAGGIVGIITNVGSITNCYHNGKVFSSKNAGGILGTAEFTQAGTVTIENCYQANGTIAGDDYANSIVGNCIYANSAKGKVNIINCYCTNDTGTSDSSKNATSDNTLTLSKSLLKKAFEDLGSYFVENTNADLNDGYPVYRWQLFTSTLKGDVNGDGEFNVADAVCLQRWLLADKRAVLSCWKNGDLCADNRIDVFDLCMMKRMLVEKFNK